MSEFFRGATLLAATLTTGLMAGLFYSWSISVMPGLARTDDRTYLAALQGMNRAILNGWFALCFAGAAILAVIAAILVAGDGRVLPWVIAGLVLYVLVLVITFTLHVPLNNQLDRSGSPDQLAALADLRRRFETTWVRWNVVRALVNTAAFGCLAWALVQFGRG
jgi:uncharacterized membrane protein